MLLIFFEIEYLFCKLTSKNVLLIIDFNIVNI